MTLRNVDPLALGEAGRLITDAIGFAGGSANSVAQDQSGHLFVTVVSLCSPLRIRWAYIGPGGTRETTIWCEESAVREACRIGPWDLERCLETLGKDPAELGLEELAGRAPRMPIGIGEDRGTL